MLQKENKYKIYFQEWLNKFKQKLNQKQYECTELYILNKDFLDFPKRGGNLNKTLLIVYKNKYVIDEEKIFVILDKNTWKKIREDYPSEIEIKVNGAYDHCKYVFEINELIYYFYFINERNEIEEGYFKFQIHDFGSTIISKFYHLTINEFIYKMNIKNINELQTINYQNNIFYFKFKGRTKKYINNNNDNNYGNRFNNNQNNINNINNLNIINNHDNKKPININNINVNIMIQNNNNNNMNKINNINNHIHNNNQNQNIIYKDNNNNNQKINHNHNQKHSNNSKNNNINIPQMNPNNFVQNIPNNNFINIKNNIFNDHNHNHNNNYNHHKRSKSSYNHRINQEIKITSPSANGLVNVGATCYMNATLQCMAHIKRVTYYFLKPENKYNILSDKYKYKLSNAYLKVLQNLWLNNNIKYYSPDNFKAVISEMNPLFAGIQANDSKDLVLFLMETMHNELNNAKKINSSNQNLVFNQTNYEESFKIFSQFFINNYKSIISDQFYGMYNSMMQCLNCKTQSHNIQVFNLIIFPLEEVRKFKNRIQNIVNIIECFEYYQKEDFMTGENQIHCNYCHTMSNSLNSSKLIICPNILVVILNRGKGLQYDIKLNFGEYLNIRNFIYYKKSPFFYELIGIVTHFGPSSMSGHFIAFCKSFVDQQWYKYNDAQVHPSSFQEASTTGVQYILFYSFMKK